MKTDAQLQHDVMAELRWDPAVHAAQIGVEVKDGVVTLAGEVGSYAEKCNAERAAQRVAGVKALAIDMAVKLSQLGQRSDADIAGSARNVLGWTSPLTADAVQVMVEAGWITLSGDVAWQFQRKEAADNVRFLPGVVGVSNQIAVRPAASAPLVRSDIEAAIKRRATAYAQAIGVHVQGTVVTLTGTVHSWAERELADHAAWASPGVQKVIDKMTLAS